MTTESFPNSAQPFKVGVYDGISFERPGFTGYTQVPLEAGLGFSALTIHVDGAHPRKRMIQGTRTYYVTEGRGTFSIGEDIHTVSEGDLFVVPPNGEYSYEGQMTLFEMNIAEDGVVRDERLEQ